MVGQTDSKLSQWRRSQGWRTLAEVADLTGLSESLLSRLERRERDVLPSTKVQMARRLRARVADLFEAEQPEEVA